MGDYYVGHLKIRYTFNMFTRHISAVTWLVIVGNAQTLEIGTCLKYNVTPTVCSSSAIVEMASALEEEELRHHTVDDKYVFNAYTNVSYLYNIVTSHLTRWYIEQFRTFNMNIRLFEA